MTPIPRIFISYSHKDQAWLERLSVHMRPLIREKFIDWWDDRRIVAGSRWREQIQEAVTSAEIAILLVSADFLASDFIAKNELPPLLDSAEAGGTVVLSLIVSPCRYIETETLARFQAVNDVRKPLIGMTPVEQEETLVELTRVVEALMSSPRVKESHPHLRPEAPAATSKGSTIQAQPAVIKVIGVGGGGGNSVQHMIDEGLLGVECIAANSDAQALSMLRGQTLLQLGSVTTKGLGAGGDPAVGRQRALDSADQIELLLRGTDLLFITAGMGGGTGTGAAPVIADIARRMGILTIGVVTKPFFFEGRKRMSKAVDGIRELIGNVDSMIVIPNDKLFSVVTSRETLLQGFKRVNEVLLGVVRGIAELLTKPGLVNVDFADMSAVMSAKGYAKMGQGTASEAERARTATELALNNPLTEDLVPASNQGVLVNITGGPDLRMDELALSGELITNHFSIDATVIIGALIDPELNGVLRVTVVSTGFAKAPEGGTTPGRPRRPGVNEPDTAPPFDQKAPEQPPRDRWARSNSLGRLFRW
jgi:cell division protein FtsZ